MRNAFLASALALAFITVLPMPAEVEFSDPDVNAADLLLFTVRADLPGGGAFRTLFRAKLGTSDIEPLSFYPEAMELLDGGRVLQVRNRFGVFRSSGNFASFKPVSGFPSFARGNPVHTGKLPDVAASPDGKYLLYFSPSSFGYGRIILFDIEKGTETVVSSGVGTSIDVFPARWSPDSRFFVYERRGYVHYYSIDQYKGARVLDESYRVAFKGRIEATAWGVDNSLFFVKDRSLYRVRSSEFFTQALYAGIVSIGTMVGTVPFSFDPNFDSFRISPDGAKLLFCKDGRNLFLYYLDPDDYGRSSRVASLPYLFLQGDTIVVDVLWPDDGLITIFTRSLRNGTRVAGAYRIQAPRSVDDASLTQTFKELEVPGALALVPTADLSRVAVVSKEGVTIRKYADWSSLAVIPAPGSLRAVWLDDAKLVVAGTDTLELVSADGSSRSLLGISNVEAGSWSSLADSVAAAKAGGRPYELRDGAWTASDSWRGRPAVANNESYRVYLDALRTGSYRNMVMVRSVKGLGTNPLFEPPLKVYAPFPDRDEARSPDIFDHGSRIRRREVTLVFNCYDTAEGLTKVLNTLADYGIKATFFVNGEFIRRAPGAAKLIAASGHEIGNMFFTTFDPTDARFKVDAEFIKRGLARTEDEYFAATGRELSLVWHTPFYSTSTPILDAARSMNYAYVGRDVDPLDWVGALEGRTIPGTYLPTAEIVERVMAKKKPGSIVPVRIGVPEGGREDYLFAELDLLIDSLLGEGYEIVPASALIEHAK